MMTTKWGALVGGDVIICPADGIEERVLFNRRGARGRRFVRTSRHDHLRPPSETVEVP